MRAPSILSQHGARLSLSLIILVFLLLHVLGILHLSPISRLENFLYDTRLNMLMPNTLDKRIVIVDLDEKSLKEQGHWPWSRNKVADLVNQLFDHYQIKVLGLDVLFSERDESSGLKTLQEIQAKFPTNQALNQTITQIKPSLDYDQLFANSIQGRNVVLGYVFSAAGDTVGVLPKPAFTLDQQSNLNSVGEATGYIANLDMLTQQANGGGFFSLETSDDGIIRSAPMLMQYGGNAYASLSIAVASVALNAPNISPVYVDGDHGNYVDFESLNLAGHTVPVDGQAATLVPYRGRQGSFPYVSATDVLNQKIDPLLLKDKIVLLGTTAAGLMDLRATPMQSAYAGVEVHANLIAGILDNNIKSKPAYLVGAEFLLLLVIGLLLAFKLPRFTPLRATIFSAIMLSAVVAFNLYAWQYANLVMPLASLLLLIVMTYVVNMAYGYFVESRGKRQITKLFGQYVPPELVDEMAKAPNAFSLKGESREMTVLFSDVRGFTTISEGLAPEQLTELMNAFLTPMTHVIHQQRGTIDKYMGDAIMAFWGAPVEDPLHAKHALDAAMGMIEALNQLQQDFITRGWPPINIGVGLNTGLMTVGNMGSQFRMAYTVMGDAVNLGSRLESLTKNYSVQIIVSEFTQAQVPEFAYRELDVVRVKGKAQPVKIFEPIGLQSGLTQAETELLRQYHQALDSYRQQDWNTAETLLNKCIASEPQRKVYQLYLDRIAFFKQNPPGAGWDGVFNFETK